MKIVIFRLTVFSLLILSGLCQYGEPIVGGVGQFTFECLQIETDVIHSPGAENYEVVAGKPFSYRCEFTADNRKCEHNPQSSGCQGVEIVWAIPSTLAQIEQEKGITRINQNTTFERKDGFDKYTNWFNITEVGKIHAGEYKWKFNLKFEMQTINEGSLRIEVIDMIQNGESCKYDDSCESNKCIDKKCGDHESKFPWLIVGISIGGLVIIALIVTLVVVYILRRKHSNNRRHNK